mmetsp:Transcript_14707/g.24493  ORF Transcript_14707/g.24493 Transcript_14707/m.24493 type:complete len:228 (+) Transcript_14707:489-1172(+)
MNRPRVPKNEIARRREEKHGVSRHRIIFVKRAPVAAPTGVALPEHSSRLFAVATRHYLQPAAVLSDVDQWHHALHTIEIRLGERVLVQVQPLCMRLPTLVEPPRTPRDHGVHGDEKIGRRPQLFEHGLDARQATHAPGTGALGEMGHQARAGQPKATPRLGNALSCTVGGLNVSPEERRRLVDVFRARHATQHAVALFGKVPQPARVLQAEAVPQSLPLVRCKGGRP